VRAAACAAAALLVLVGLPGLAQAAPTVATTIALVDSAGAPLPGASIAYYRSGGSRQPPQMTGADGAVHLNLAPATYNFQATWNGGSLLRQLVVGATHTTLTFQTRDVSVPVVDSQDSGIAGAVVNHYGPTGSWVGNRTTGPSGVLHYELLDGTYHFQATYNGGARQQVLTVDAAHTALTFQTLDVSALVADAQGDGIAGAVVNHYGSTGSWVGNRTTGASGILHDELLAGTYHFQATYNGGSQEQTLAVDATHRTLTFTTLDVVVALLDSQGAGLAGGVQNHYGSTDSWVGNRTTSASGLLHYELLPGSYTFQATWNGGSQQRSLVADATHTSLTFRTFDVAVSVLDRAGGGIAGAVVNHYGSTGSWVGNRTTGASGALHDELLPGAYHFQATSKDGSQQRSLAVGPGGVVLTFTTSVDVSPPQAPTLTATPATDLPLASGDGTVLLRVLAGPDAVRVVVRRDGDVIHDGAVPRDLADEHLQDETRYHYTAVAYDAAGNASAAADATADTPDRTASVAPPAPEGAGYPLHVAWPDELGTTFTLARDGTEIARTTQQAVTDADAVDADAPPAPGHVEVSDPTPTGLTLAWGAVADRGTSYRYTVHGEDQAGNVGNDSPAAHLVAASGVAGYRVLVNGVIAIATTTDTTVTLTGLPSGVRRTITVLALDAAGNLSAPSAAVTAGGDEAPAAPAGIDATTTAAR
jgi:hypothetical protein